MHALECRQKRNAAKLEALNLTAKDGKQLFAVAASRRRRGKWRAPEILYAHANDPAAAKLQVVSGESEPIHIISVGLAIGWFEHESGLIASE
jgi:hypothetical protein